MRTTISARHTAVDDALRARTERVLERLGHFSSRAVGATAVFDTVAGRPAAELRLHCAGKPTLISTAAADGHRSALDKAEARMKRQLARVADRPRASRHSPDIG